MTSVWCSDEAAVPRRVRPRVETPALRRFFRHPDLLERRPVIGRPLRPEEPAAVGRLEAVVHLQAAPVGRAGIRPAAFEVMDAHELAVVRWMLGLAPVPGRLVLPADERLLRASDT